MFLRGRFWKLLQCGFWKSNCFFVFCSQLHESFAIRPPFFFTKRHFITKSKAKKRGLQIPKRRRPKAKPSPVPVTISRKPNRNKSIGIRSMLQRAVFHKENHGSTALPRLKNVFHKFQHYDALKSWNTVFSAIGALQPCTEPQKL